MMPTEKESFEETSGDHPPASTSPGRELNTNTNVSVPPSRSAVVPCSSQTVCSLIKIIIFISEALLVEPGEAPLGGEGRSQYKPFLHFPLKALSGAADQHQLHSVQPLLRVMR